MRNKRSPEMVEQITSAKLLVLFETYSIFDVIIFN